MKKRKRQRREPKTICSISKKGDCLGCRYSRNPSLWDGGCTCLNKREIVPNPRYQPARFRKVSKAQLL